jgi:hypothetical protein
MLLSPRQRKVRWHRSERQAGSSGISIDNGSAQNRRRMAGHARAPFVASQLEGLADGVAVPQAFEACVTKYTKRTPPTSGMSQAPSLVARHRGCACLPVAPKHSTSLFGIQFAAWACGPTVRPGVIIGVNRQHRRELQKVSCVMASPHRRKESARVTLKRSPTGCRSSE